MAAVSPADPTSERISALDLVRGIAVLGIVIPNIIGMGQPMIAYGWPDGFLAGPGPFADELWAAQLVLVDGKFRAIFTLLFGVGMTLFYRRAVAKGWGSALLARRLGWLAIFGLLHWFLLWRGDILFSYAVAGIVALPFIAWPASKQAVLGLVGYAIGAVLLLGVVSLLTSLDATGLGDLKNADLADAATEMQIMASGGHLAWMTHGIDEHWDDLVAGMVWPLFEAVPLILIGMSLVAAGIFDGRADPRRQLRWGFSMWLAGTAATVAIAASIVPDGIGYADSIGASAWAAIPTLLSALGLLALLSYWAQRARGWLSRRLAAAGRCAFTNYIGTSALALIVFSGWGLGLFGRLGRLELYAIMLVFWAIMLAWPTWWLARFRYGPLEWLWRCLTYGRRFALRR